MSARAALLFALAGTLACTTDHAAAPVASDAEVVALCAEFPEWEQSQGLSPALWAELSQQAFPALPPLLRIGAGALAQRSPFGFPLPITDASLRVTSASAAIATCPTDQPGVYAPCPDAALAATGCASLTLELAHETQAVQLRLIAGDAQLVLEPPLGAAVAVPFTNGSLPRHARHRQLSAQLAASDASDVHLFTRVLRAPLRDERYVPEAAFYFSDFPVTLKDLTDALARVPVARAVVPGTAFHETGLYFVVISQLHRTRGGAAGTKSSGVLAGVSQIFALWVE